MSWISGQFGGPTTTNSPPQDVLNNYNGVFDRAMGVADVNSGNYTPYTGQLVAGLNPGQQTSIGQLQGVYGSQMPYMNAASQSLGSAAQGLGNVQNYLMAGSQAGANASNYANSAAAQYGNATGYAGQSANALAAMQPYMNQTANGIATAQNTYGQGLGALGQVGGYLNNASGALNQQNSALGQVGGYLQAGSGALGSAQGYFGQAAGYAAPVAFSQAALQQYMNPYTQDVINTTMAQAHQDQHVQATNLASNEIGSGAYGGDRGGIAQAALAGQQTMANNSTVAGLNNQNYMQAVGQFNQEQADRFQAAGILNQSGMGEVAAAGQYGNLGSTQLGVASGYGANAQGWNQTAGNQLATAGQYANIAGGQLNAAQGYNALTQAQGQIAQQYGNLGTLSNQIGAGYTGLGNQSLQQGGLYSTLGQLQGTTGQAQGSLAGVAGYLGSQALSTGITGAQAGLQAATLQQQVQQQRDTAAYQQYMQGLQYPFQTTGWLSNIAQGIGSNSGGTSTTSTPIGTQAIGAGLGLFGALGAGGAFNGMFSDERVKEDIKPIGKAFDGQMIYRFRYKGDPTVRTGLMAQEVEKRTPSAVGEVGGIKTVDYGRATEAAAERGHFARGGGLGLAPVAIGLPWRPGMGGLGSIAAIHPTVAKVIVPKAVRHLRPHFDDGGVITFNPTATLGAGLIPDGSFGQQQQTTGRGVGIPGGGFNNIPNAPAAKPSGLGVLSNNPGAGGSSNGLAGGIRNPDGSLSTNAWLGITAAGLGMMAGTGSAGQNIGAGGLEGMKMFTQLNQADRAYGFQQQEFGLRQQDTKIKQQQVDQGAQEIANTVKYHQAELANQTAQIANQTASTASENAARDQTSITNRYQTTYIPGMGMAVRDVTRPYDPPRIVGQPGADASQQPADMPASPAVAPRVAPPPAPAPVPITGSAKINYDSSGNVNGISDNPAAPAVPPIKPVAAVPPPQAAPSPVTLVPKNYVPPNQAAIYLNPGQLKIEQENAAKDLEAVRTQSQSAAQVQFRLGEMNDQIANLPTTGPLAAGAFATERASWAKSANAIVQSFGGDPVFDPSQIASHELLAKDRFRLGAELAKSLGGREPGFIVQQAVTANPGADNTAMGYKRITAGLQSAAQYAQDKAAFYNDYSAKYGHLNGAQELFTKLKPPQDYVNKAIVSTVDPRDLQVLTAHADNPAARAKFDKIYGSGVSNLALGGQ